MRVDGDSKNKYIYVADPGTACKPRILGDLSLLSAPSRNHSGVLGVFAAPRSRPQVEFALASVSKCRDSDIYGPPRPP